MTKRTNRSLALLRRLVSRTRGSWPRLPGVAWLDVKLGARLLAKYPGMTLAACFALAIGIPVGLVPLQLNAALNAPPPFHRGERLLGIEQFDVAVRNEEQRILHAFEGWQRELKSFERLAALSHRVQNLVDRDGRVEPVPGTEITASALRLLRARPLLGRMLVESDEIRGSEPVVVLEYDFWQRRFGGDSGLVGRTIQLGAVTRTVVGVMPPGFKFPYRNDKYWVPLQARALEYDRGRGPRLLVFGRLRDGVSTKTARAELEAVGRRNAAAYPETDAQLRPRVLQFTLSLTGLRPTLATVFTTEFAALLLLAVACGNVGTLMLARTSARSTELAVRTALGASRGRIIGQLFIESLVLATVAATVGLTLAHLLVRRLKPLQGEMPAWFHLGMTPRTAALGAALAAFSAVIAGVLPAVKATGKDVHRSLQRGATGASGLRIGAVATVLIVAEVALAVGFLSVVGTMARNVLRNPAADIGLAAEEYLSAELRVVAEPPAGVDTATYRRDSFVRFAATLAEAVRRIQSEPGVRGIALAGALPGMDHPRALVAVEGVEPSGSGRPGFVVRTVGVLPGFFHELGQLVLDGRDFDARDLAGSRNAVIVNRSFVARVLHGQNPIGRRIRYVGDQSRQVGPWYEIVGVVNDLGMSVANPELSAGLYHPARLGSIYPVRLAVRLTTDPTAFAPRLRAIVAAIDPEILVRDPLPLDEVTSGTLWEARFASFAFATLAAVALVLSVAGLYALMSFTVSARAYEIAIRTALGADARHVVRIVLARSLGQLAAGVAIGGGIGAVMASQFAVDPTTPNHWPTVVAAVATVMTVVGALACSAPTVRALRIQPIEALKAQG